MKDLDNDDDKEWLSKGWDDPEGEHVQSYVESEGGGWTANQVGLDNGALWFVFLFGGGGGGGRGGGGEGGDGGMGIMGAGEDGGVVSENMG